MCRSGDIEQPETREAVLALSARIGVLPEMRADDHLSRQQSREGRNGGGAVEIVNYLQNAAIRVWQRDIASLRIRICRMLRQQRIDGRLDCDGIIVLQDVATVIALAGNRIRTTRR